MNRRLHDRVFGVLTRKRDERTSRLLHDLIADVLIFGPMLVSAAVVATLAGIVSLAGSWPWYFWVIVSPLFYVGWLVVFLSINAWVSWQIGSRNPKPRHAVVHPDVKLGSKEILGMATAAMCYRRFVMLQTIPLASLLADLPHFDVLILRAYSP